MKSADFLVGGMAWEVKSPIGSSRKSTIKNQLKGLGQSRDIVIDGRRSGLSDDYIVAEIHKNIKLGLRARRLLYINKKAIIVDLKRKRSYNKT